LTGLLADVFALYVKTKNFHWHMSGPHFRDYHLLLDEQSAQIFLMTDPILSVAGRSLQQRCDPSDKVPGLNVSGTMMRIMSNRGTCLLSCETTIFT
jgi:DNA-binding ferritin-like protein